AKALTEAYSSNGKPMKTLPRGFYLRTQFTEQILLKHYINVQSE
ncbi:DNA mismatch repair protein MutH, partial [Vibrio sp. 1579]|nr:DNA mismatch repair protein MutH [Vibrio sp. 1579]